MLRSLCCKKTMVTMSKDTNFSGHPVLSQIIKLINRDKVHKLATTTIFNYFNALRKAYDLLAALINAEKDYAGMK